MAKKKKKLSAPAIPVVPQAKGSATTKGEAASEPATPPPPGHSVTREVFESLAIAVMLAFFIRTFVAEPFVIPTGSMAPTLMGAHKDVYCPQCGERFKVNASRENAESEKHYRDLECVAGVCPMCRYTVVFKGAVGNELALPPESIVPTPTYNGDRIVVNKFLYSFTEPERWDVIVFKFPGHASDNYIKRLVGLPGENLMVYQGDVFVGDGESDSNHFAIAAKPPSTLLAMRHPVHDTFREPSLLYKKGWPLRWSAEGEASGWKAEIDDSAADLKQRFVAEGAGENWLRYRHVVPTQEAWQALEQGGIADPRPKLIDDFYSYNAAVTMGQVNKYAALPLQIPSLHQGIHWVGDLIVEADLESASSEGELLLELVEGGHRFRAVVDLASGEARLEALPWQSSEPTTLAKEGKTSLHNKGKHRVMFANVDDQLHLWVDDKLVEFDNPTNYDWQALFGDRQDNIPRTSPDDPGDFAPVGIGTRDASLAVDRLRVWRDVYYLATRVPDRQAGGLHDYPAAPSPDLLYNPRLWSGLDRRKKEVFKLGEDQFFVMGDNSPASQDARLWYDPPWMQREHPGGNYLERKMLIGRAVGVVWPHTWDYVIPGISDMRLIR